MKNAYLLAILIAAPLVAAPQGATFLPVPASPYPQTSTTGMIGFTTNQTARISVLNLNSVPAAGVTAPTNCTVELQFVDGQNNSIKEVVVPNFAPSTATSLDLQRTEVTAQTTPRAQIRGIVIVNPAPAITAVASVTGLPATAATCGVKVTLEIFDTSTGSTVALTTDTSSIGSGLSVVISPIALTR